MKDIKSVMIGFLLATSMFLFMGQTKATSNEIGRYQAFSDNEGKEFIIDTTTGALWICIYNERTSTWSWYESVKANNFKK